MTLVVDASVAVAASTGATGFAELRDDELFAPPLMWSEARSALHRAQWLGRISHDAAWEALLILEESPVRPRTHRRLGREAWQIANRLGWMNTYDAEYVALASIIGCRMVTVDKRLRHGADRLGFVVGPMEL